MKRIGWLLFLALVIYFIFLIRQDIIDNLSLKKEKDRAAAGIEAQESLSQELRGRLVRLKGEDLIEELARTKLGLIKKGETAYKVISK